MNETSAPPAAAAPAPSRRRLWVALRLLVTVAAFAYLFSIVSVGELWSAVASLPPQRFGVAVVLAYAAVGVGTLRWRILLAACGASSRPSYVQLYRLYLVGSFYNQFVPGAIGGDIVRGVATGHCFEKDGATSAIAVTVLERVAGFAGLLLVFAAASWLRPLGGIEGLNRWAALGGVLAALGVLGLLTGRRFARWLPGPIARVVERLPRLHSMPGLVLALALSLVTHSAMAAMTHALASGLVPGLHWQDSFVVTPVGMLATYFPLTVGGAGARETTFVKLFPLVGVDEPAALATSLGWWAATLIMAASGGVLNAITPLRSDAVT